MSDLYRLIYASRKLLQGSEVEIAMTVQQIIAVSRRKNTRADVTGALMFNESIFTQVLEGPRRSVDETFERVRSDCRHSDVAVLQYKTAKERSFVDCSMTLVGQSAHGRAYFNNLVEQSGSDPSRMNTTAFLRCCIVLCWMENEDRENPLPATDTFET
jgi:hypothetical protein